MTDLFAKRRARLLALKALRDGQSHPALGAGDLPQPLPARPPRTNTPHMSGGP